MPTRCKRLSEYGRNYKWKTSKRSEHRRPASPLQKCPSAGLRSDQLGITKEPNFISKRRVPYYKTQISKSFEWKGENNAEKNSSIPPESIKLPVAQHRVRENQENIPTPDAPRLLQKTRARSEDSRVKYVQETPVTDGEKLPPCSVVEQKEADAASKTDLEKENGLHRVLKKKAGLQVAPLNSLARNSEYKRQFIWKNPLQNSPVLAAEQVIYSKPRPVTPFKADVVNSETEYRSQFKGSPPVKGPKLRRNYDEISQYEPENISPEEKKKESIALKSGEGSPRQDQSETEQKQANQRKAMRQRYLQRRLFPHQGYGKVKTEYTANFMSPVLYKYRDGAWVHSKHMKAEVKELRDKASIYRQRAQGTHFSRDHLNQLLSNNNRLWDVSSNSSVDALSNNIKALDLAGVHETHPFPSTQKLAQHDIPSSGERKGPLEEGTRQDNTGMLVLSDAPTLPVSRRLAWGEEDNPEIKVTPAAAISKEKDDNRTEEEIERLQLNDDEKEGSDAAEVILDSVHSWEGGRLPTPKLKTFSGAQRTHHDLTTPAVGGAVLVCPDKREEHLLERRKRAPLENQHSPPRQASGEPSKRKLSKNEDDRLIQSSPSAGVKTLDPLPLREDPWPGTHASGTGASPVLTHSEQVKTPVQNSPSALAPPYWIPSCRIQGALKDPEFQHNGNCGSPDPLKLPLHRMASDDDDDRLSQISARSAASSSLASQILEHAQRRKENFWGKK
ncbi:nuclear protein MDM1 isoform X2 [Microcaecilia unicolor]|uniref:Nuclear protein MDM1 n=1 Tax=Microcaecilia unicolor TaxID=1415580 RepID=A0A6P7Z1Z5_9AMPH|nr:nuclear protein MDM1 isoform X2 [Microcaecilia unicolor]